jgi:UDP-N-acetylglucosamine 2-epimerase (non-hydrolysing)
MKIAALLAALEDRPEFTPTLIHTGQHYSPEMSDSFFQDLGIRRPDVSLEIGGGTSTTQVARVMLALEPLFCSERPDLTLVVGDVNATLAATLVSVRMGIPVAHVEAGLRSFDRTMPEEVNRVLTDSVADFLFTSEREGDRNLLREGIPQERIFFCGNVMIDTLLRFRERALQQPVLENLGLRSGEYVVVTLHRPSNVDDPARLTELVAMLGKLSSRIPVVFSVHPRTGKIMADHGVECGPAILRIPPQGYLDFLKLLSSARLVLTDSGGIQEETTILEVPCLTLRANTERPATISAGTNRLAGVDPETILKMAMEALDAPPLRGRRPELWDGKAASRIVDMLAQVV